jgi:hypothetical protein
VIGSSMAPIKHRSRIHPLAAKEAPVVVILQRKRSKLFHIITVNTEKHLVTEGSWFSGRIHEMKCDVSFDDEFLVYLAIGRKYTAWSGLCRLPWLTTLVESENPGINWGGGYFSERNVLITNGWRKISTATDFPSRSHPNRSPTSPPRTVECFTRSSRATASHPSAMTVGVSGLRSTTPSSR